jgi:hypothetical protein
MLPHSSMLEFSTKRGQTSDQKKQLTSSEGERFIKTVQSNTELLKACAEWGMLLKSASMGRPGSNYWGFKHQSCHQSSNNTHNDPDTPTTRAHVSLSHKEAEID